MDSSQNDHFTVEDDTANIITKEEDENGNECSAATDKSDAEHSISPLSFFALFSFASCVDGFLIFFAILAAIAAGFVTPIMMHLFGNAMNAFVNGDSFANTTNYTDRSLENIPLLMNVEEKDPMEQFKRFSFYVSLFGTSRFLLSFLFYSFFNYAAEKQVYRIRSQFLQAVLRQDMSWYDTATSNDFASRITEDLNKIQEGIGCNLGILVYCISISLSCFGTAFYHGWELTLVMLSSMPIITIATGMVTRIQASLAEAESKAYAKSGGVAEEVLSSIRTVMAFGGQQKEIERYEKSLSFAQKAGRKRGIATGIGAGLNSTINYASYALVFWYGMNLVLKSNETNTGYTVGDIVTIFFCVLLGSSRLGRASPYIEAISVARGAGATIFSIINRVPPIDSSSESGIKPDYIFGDIYFQNIWFNYPSRPDVKILNGLNFQVASGQTVALVGTSGCGKSTCIQLLQRFYDPQEGKVCIDGYDIRDLNIGWMRAQIGMVGQEPVLFGTTIGENIRYGRDGVTQEEIKVAAKEANAHDFILRLPLKYDTMVGERGAQLSGGQKQRIAIARALVRNPKILLLDEATSALDTQSEAVVQRALEKARLGRTTIIVAHRLSTIRNADRIIVIKDGVVEEKGNHRTLMDKRGSYYELVVSQGYIGNTLSQDETSERNPRNVPSHLTELDFHDDTVDEEECDDRKLPDSIDSSESAQDINSETDKHEENSTCKTSSMMEILRLNKKEWPIILTGVIGSTIVGLSTPAYAILFAQMMSVLSAGGTVEEQEAKREQGDFYSLLFLIMGLVVGLADFAQNLCYTIAGESLTSRIRSLAFQALLKKETAWFDREENNVGSLCVRLSGDAASVKGATGPRIGIVCEAISTIIVSIIMSLYYEWRLGLLTLSFTPISFLFVYLNGRLNKKHSNMERISLQQSAKVATEAIGNIRTVASLGKEKQFHDRFMDALRDSHKNALKIYWMGGLVYGISNSMGMFTYSATFYYGGWLVTYDGVDYRKVIAITEALIMGTMYVGEAYAFSPSYQKAKVAADRIFALIRSTPIPDATLSNAKQMEDVTGRVEFDQVEFQYPNRKDTKVLQGLSLTVTAGQNVALVGQSGCGKSTCIQLLERFYDPDVGQVKLDGQNIRSVDITSLRSHMSIVSQEPVLFNRTIGENIAYGDNSREVPMDEIIESARKSNIHSFIQSLPNGYDTMVGERGTQLSGGQKQRVAIARALVRNPKILLLDEATSALDSESERVVQTALDTAREGRTCITIAHRLSTIKNSDVIYVINNGKIEEQGTHDDLIKRNGLYAELCSLQGVSVSHRGIPFLIA